MGQQRAPGVRARGLHAPPELSMPMRGPVAGVGGLVKFSRVTVRMPKYEPTASVAPDAASVKTTENW